MTAPRNPAAASPLPQVGQTPSGRPPVIPVVLLGSGVFLAWFAIHYWRSTTALPTDVVKSVLQGKGLPPVVRADTPLQYASGPASVAANAGAVGSIPADHAQIAADGLQYVGQGYVYGGRADRPGNWDCSSFLSYVLGHDFGLSLPGGGHYGDAGYPPHEHGPVASAYKLYGIGINQSALLPGDLVVWNTHCGIAIDRSHIVAARTTATGTGTSTIDGVTNELAEQPVFRRLVSTTAPAGGGGRSESIR